MSNDIERKEFERKFPVPGGIFWNEVSEQYDAAPGSGRDELVEIYHGQWIAWQAAREQGAEPVADQWLIQLRGDYLVARGVWEGPDHRGYTNDIGEAGRYSEDEAKKTESMAPDKYKAVRLPYTQPQSAGVPEGFVLMPESLTAENGAKYALSGEFHEVVELGCTACDEDEDDCEVCSGHGSYTYRVPISWTAIKDIYSLAVSKCSAATTPQPAGNWVRCSERLPPAGKWLSGLTDTGRVIPAKMVDNGDSTYFRVANDELSEGAIVGWQPLPGAIKRPQPPREQGGEQ